MITENIFATRMRWLAQEREITRLTKLQPEIWALVRMQLNGRQPERNYVHDRINERVATLEAIDKFKRNTLKGWLIGIVVWQRDCDCAEWTSFDTLPANKKAMDKYVNDLYANAEGPVSFHWCDIRDKATFQPHSRDRVMEAFENGSNYAV